METMKKVLAFGEVMLRIAMNNYQMIEQTKDARLNFTGTGLNVLSGLTHFDYAGALLTQLPDNRLGDAAKAEIRKLGIDDHLIKSSGHHMGIYFLEQGFGNRPSEVTYLDRLHSSFGESRWSPEELQSALVDVQLVHICGISLLLTQHTRNAAFQLAMYAKERGIPVCFDFNYRPSLVAEQEKTWMKERYEAILPYVDIVIGSPRDLFELLALPAEVNSQALPDLVHYFMQKFDLSYFAGTRRTKRAEQRFLQGFLYSKQGSFDSKIFPLYIFDRVGTGDAFVAGLLASLLEGKDLQACTEFATASAVLAHTTLGDSPIVTRKQVQAFLEDQSRELIR